VQKPVMHFYVGSVYDADIFLIWKLLGVFGHFVP